MRTYLRDSAILLLLAGVMAVPASAESIDGPQTGYGNTADGLKTSDWQAIRQEYEPNRRAVFAVPGGYQARNHGQSVHTL